MKCYIGAKIITAEPLTLGLYNERRGWTIPANEDPNRPGYYIVYPDDYVSWSPKEVFDEAYRPVSAGERDLIGSHNPLQEIADEHAVQPEPKNFIDRLKGEREDLNARVTKLAEFMSNGAPGTTALHKEMLGRQLIAMSEYLVILDERLTDLGISARSAPVENIDGE